MGVADCFLEVAKLEFFYDEAPEGMKSIGAAYWTTGIGKFTEHGSSQVEFNENIKMTETVFPVRAFPEEIGLRQDFTQDGTTDLKGRRVLRPETGKWKACYFMLGYEMCERMAYYGISANLVLYLTREMKEGTVKSSNNVTNWVGTVWMTPIIGAYIADTYLGRYWTFMIASIVYVMFALMGVADCFLEVAKLEFFYDQAPEGMKSLGTAYWTTSIGIGYFLSSFILSTVVDVTKNNGHKGWILDNLNDSRVDYYYAFYAVLSFVNLLFFLLVAKYFVYNTEVNEPDNELQEDIGKFTEQGYIAC
ncbi:NRT1/ PTR family 5.2-like protein [Tanacetum coccineum]